MQPSVKGHDSHQRLGQRRTESASSKQVVYIHLCRTIAGCKWLRSVSEWAQIEAELKEALSVARQGIEEKDEADEKIQGNSHHDRKRFYIIRGERSVTLG